MFKLDLPEELKETQGSSSQLRRTDITEPEDTFQSKYIELEDLGEGGAAVVRACRNILSGKEYACKVMRKRANDIEKEMACRAEYELMTSIVAHPHIVRPVEYLSSDSWTYTVMELARGHELQEVVTLRKVDLVLIKEVMR